MSYIENLTCDQQKAIEELEKRMKNAITPRMREDPTVFFRFLKARDFDVDRAEKMLLKHITSRKVYQTDTILENFKPMKIFTEYAEPRLVGCDKNGDAVIYTFLGDTNAVDFFRCMKIPSVLKHLVWCIEKIAAYLKMQNAKTGRSAYQAVVILDINNVTFSNVTSKLSINAFHHYMQLYQDNYPELLKSLYLINAPSFYVIAFSIIKTALSSATIKKIKVFGHNGWKEKLLQIIDADVLPAFLGGNRTDPDGNPMCKSFLTFGGKISEIYFLSEEERYFRDRTRVQRIAVPTSEKKEIHVDVKEAGVFIQWEFLVKGKDIGFGFNFQISEQEVQELIPVQKYATSEGTERDSYKCHSAGQYTIIFDNSYSWWTSKDVEYCVTILEKEL